MGNHDGEEGSGQPEQPGVQRVYLYFDDLNALGQRVFSRLRVDTWYFRMGRSAVGELELGTAPVQAIPQAEFVARTWRDALAALAPIYHPIDPISIRAWSPPWGDAVSGTRIDEEYAPEELEAALHALARTHERDGIVFTKGWTRLDTMAAVRSWTGEMEEQRFGGAGYLAIYSNASMRRYPRLDPYPSESVMGPWAYRAFLACSATSLFFADNSDVLIPARRYHLTQKQELTRGAESTTTSAPNGEEEEETFAGSITLLDPPPETPKTNQELYERNAPRLRAAIAQWERLSGHPFQWSRGFRRHGYP